MIQVRAKQAGEATAGEAEKSAQWAWLNPTLEQLSRLGLSGAVYDGNGKRVLDFVSPAPLGQVRRAICPGTPDAHRAGLVQCLNGRGTTQRVQCQMPGSACLLVPIRQHRRTIGVARLCVLCRDLPDSEELARICQQRKTDRELVLRLVRQASRFDSTQLDVVEEVARCLLDSAAERNLLDAELGTLSENLTNTYEEVSLLHKVSAGMKVTEKPADHLHGMAMDLLEVMNVESLAVRYFRPDQPLISEHIGVGAELTEPRTEQAMWDEMLAMFESGAEELLDNHVGGKPSGRAEVLSALSGSSRVRQVAAVPLVRNGRLCGALVAMNKLTRDFDSVDLKLMKSIAAEGAMFLENAFLYEDLQQLLLGMLRALVSSIDAKDPYTCGHSERVGMFAAKIAAAAGLSEAECRRVYLAGLLHDIGKIGVPEAVLTKPGRLTRNEFAVMRRHPEIGARILAGIKQVEDLVPGVLHHHERVDGKGYPKELAGNAVPRIGLIIGLADCFDAMTSDRAYRRALPLEVALAEIRRFAGTQFDPRAVEAFFRLDAAEMIRQARQIPPHDPLGNMVQPAGSLLGPEMLAPV